MEVNRIKQWEQDQEAVAVAVEVLPYSEADLTLNAERFLIL